MDDRRLHKMILFFKKIILYNVFSKVNYCEFTHLSENLIKKLLIIIIINSQIYSFELENIDPFKLAKILMLPQTTYYKDNRIPLVLTDKTERHNEYLILEKRNKLNPPQIFYNMKSSEEFHKQKCKIKEFHYIREIAYTYNPETLIKWESCNALEIEKKKYIMDGKDEHIPILLKDRTDRWKKVLSEEIDGFLVKPLPKFNSKIIDKSIKREAEEYYTILINHILDGEFLGTVIGTENVPHTLSSSAWYNRQINEFNQYVYGEKISQDEKKIKINSNSEMLKNLRMGYLYAMMTSHTIKLFPAKTQTEENDLILNAIRTANNHLLYRLEGYTQEKKRLTNAFSCLENWSKWHKENLRMAYYYGFYLEYGKEVRFSEDIKKSLEYSKMAEAIENRILTSDIFLKRLGLLEKDVCSVSRKSKEEIEGTF